MARSGVDVYGMCPRAVLKDELSFNKYALWMENAVTSLNALSLKDPEQERVRKECLEEIKKFLDTKESWKFFSPLRQIILDINNAVKDVAKNFDLLISLREKLEPHNTYYWDEAVADEIPDQAEAVISITAKTGAIVDRMCIIRSVEELSFEENVLWMENAVASLNALSLTDPEQEAIRKKCLNKIEKSLARKESWEY